MYRTDTDYWLDKFREALKDGDNQEVEKIKRTLKENGYYIRTIGIRNFQVVKFLNSRRGNETNGYWEMR